ncbi:hypothetical protein ACQUQU_12805 [Thalassolituus sp. LLYu03]|uniref:hypothetical protein n=1 Tax=Thalassolituus sp. LLYu03 TaxID=3421656 RepID=UPI003D2BE186
MNIGSTTGSAFTAGSYAIDQGVSRVNRAAQDVVDATTSRPVEGVGETSSALVEMREGENSVKAGAKVVEAQDKALGSLIDIQA